MRKKYFINPRFQTIFMAVMGGVSFLVILIYFLSHQYFFWKLRQLGIDLGLPTGSVFFQYIEKQASLLHLVSVGAAVIVVLTVGVVGILFSHRICGPLYRLQQHMSKIAKGTPPGKVKFRKKDYFPELADGFNEMVEQMHKRN